MDTHKRQQSNDDSSAQKKSIPCRGGCGFFGSLEHSGYCSICYKQLHPSDISVEKEEKPLIIEKSLFPPKIKQELKEEEEKEIIQKKPSKEKTDKALKKIKKAKKNRCQICRKKLGFMPFKCQCGLCFCSEHRLPSDHSCSFDHRSIQSQHILEANPVILQRMKERL
ncbi:zinc finger A20 and AN1 domain-containing stress-associated protein 1-like [Aduncisulcus paluster]|uniref:Zinc finger A20 and AN1 domain-containing stress-associated protein 1-like n=1 Tax=Aduncisulcus paluster TaxID=2918883 RepID=A0ABQ5KQM0_9EUKA|nr:zinc finger A20 and AN1 domain-containing stress-associated protein 1-like [Aduncisulcus paluster]|eukprot:gnl/Carplike_NY0171/68_a90_8831.p1 GENE.gnl/Carplike_NY0171/68_a90_8831~~gnl/Carplike_NY0171/68_a90_8831.p1  ORF type:complete len:191 (+),score=34.00 gnl/Carplike_NY0171/68_a90_8831:73-573(+)